MRVTRKSSRVIQGVRPRRRPTPAQTPPRMPRSEERTSPCGRGRRECCPCLQPARPTHAGAIGNIPGSTPADRTTRGHARATGLLRSPRAAGRRGPPSSIPARRRHDQVAAVPGVFIRASAAQRQHVLGLHHGQSARGRVREPDHRPRGIVLVDAGCSARRAAPPADAAPAGRTTSRRPCRCRGCRCRRPGRGGGSPARASGPRRRGRRRTAGPPSRGSRGTCAARRRERR